MGHELDSEMTTVYPNRIEGIEEYAVTDADKFLDQRKPKRGLALFAHNLFRNSQYYAFAPPGKSQRRINSLFEYDIHESWDECETELLNKFKGIANGKDECTICVQMLIATERDFPSGEDFEIESRPFRSNYNGVTYISAPIKEIEEDQFRAFIDFDIGFDAIIVLLNQPLTKNWFDLSDSEKNHSVLAVAYDIYNQESYMYSAASHRV